MIRSRKRGVIVAGALLCSAALYATTAGAQTFSNNQTGTNNGFYYSLWSNGQGSVSMTLGSAGNYSVNWSNIGDFTSGKGWSTGSGRNIGYNAGVYNNSGGGSLAVYGWSTNPLVEYYVAESWNGLTQGTNMGTYTSDGSTYTIYKHQQVNQPSIVGTATFWQYISVRNSQRKSGTVTMQNHINAWASHGMNLGAMNMQIMLTEGWNGSGQSNVTVWDAGSGGGSSGGGSSGGGSSGGGSTGGGGSSGAVTLNSWQANQHSSDLTVWTGGVGGFQVGDWLQFNNVNMSGKTLMNFNLASAQSGSFKVVLDSYYGTQVCSVSYGSTGGWNNYANKSCSLSASSGSHTLYVIDSSGAANLGTMTVQ